MNERGQFFALYIIFENAQFIPDEWIITLYYFLLFHLLYSSFFYIQLNLGNIE